MTDVTRVPADRLRHLIDRIFTAAGVPAADAATVVEVLGGVLSGGLFGTDVPPMKGSGREPLITSAFPLAIDPERFMPLDKFRARIDRLVDQVKASELASGVEEVLVAGEPEARRRVERLRDGIPLSTVVLAELRGVARELGRPPALA